MSRLLSTLYSLVFKRKTKATLSQRSSNKNTIRRIPKAAITQRTSVWDSSVLETFWKETFDLWGVGGEHIRGRRQNLVLLHCLKPWNPAEQHTSTHRAVAYHSCRGEIFCRVWTMSHLSEHKFHGFSLMRSRICMQQLWWFNCLSWFIFALATGLNFLSLVEHAHTAAFCIVSPKGCVNIYLWIISDDKPKLS